MSSSSEELDLTPPDIAEEAKLLAENLLPAKSKERLDLFLMETEGKPTMAATTIALRGVHRFISAGRAAAARRPPPATAKPRRKPKPVLPSNKIPPNTLELLFKETNFCKQAKRAAMLHKLKEKHIEHLCKNTHFTKDELTALYKMYRQLVGQAQAAALPAGIGQPPPKSDGIDQNTFRDVMHSTFQLVTEDIILDRLWTTWERGPAGGEGALSFEPWTRGLSILLRGTDEERLRHCFNVYDLNSDGYITRDEMFLLLKNSLLKQPGDEDPDEGVRDLVELVLRKLDGDKDGKVSPEDYIEAVENEPLLLEAFGQCLPSRRLATAFLKTLVTKQ